MKSKITIEVDFENNNQPVIQVLNNTSSDDVRDKLISVFVQSLSHTSRWCTIEYVGLAYRPGDEAVHRWKIAPIRPLNLKEEMKLMKVVFDEYCQPITKTEE